MVEIDAKKILYIKLGEGGAFETDCLTKDQTLQLDYRGVDHNLCIRRDWVAVHSYFTSVEKTSQAVATSHTNQVKEFYEADEHTLWITFYANKLWWCFSKPKITILPNKTKTRPVIGKWSDKGISGKDLTTDSISGKLLKTQGYRGTICSVSEMKYTVARINGKKPKEVGDAESALRNLNEKLCPLIQGLPWKDFEILIDLIFRQAGWQRVGATGKTQKTLDLDLLAPVTGERAIVQIKSQSNINELKDYEAEFMKFVGYNKFFYIVHTPTPDLYTYQTDSGVILYFIEKITDLTISSGLVNWVIKKAS